jgi:hypothetical protein
MEPTRGAPDPKMTFISKEIPLIKFARYSVLFRVGKFLYGATYRDRYSMEHRAKTPSVRIGRG